MSTNIDFSKMTDMELVEVARQLGAELLRRWPDTKTGGLQLQGGAATAVEKYWSAN